MNTKYSFILANLTVALMLIVCIIVKILENNKINVVNLFILAVVCFLVANIFVFFLILGKKNKKIKKEKQY